MNIQNYPKELMEAAIELAQGDEGEAFVILENHSAIDEQEIVQILIKNGHEITNLVWRI